MDGCGTCAKIHESRFSNIIIENDAAIAQVVDYFREGHCCVIVKEHRESISQLEENEYTGVFELISKVSKALETKYKASKTYLLVIGDSSPVDHLHFHLIPKHKDKCSMGEYCFGRLIESEGKRNTTEVEKDKTARELQKLVGVVIPRE